MACRPCPVQIGWTRANDGVATENAVLQGVACALNCRMTVPSNVEHSRFLSDSSSGSRRPVVSVNIREHSARRPLRRKHPALSISSLPRGRNLTWTRIGEVREGAAAARYGRGAYRAFPLRHCCCMIRVGQKTRATMTDRSYLQRRAAQERRAATEARHPKAQQAHLELASQYEQRSEATAEQN